MTEQEAIHMIENSFLAFVPDILVESPELSLAEAIQKAWERDIWRINQLLGQGSLGPSSAYGREAYATILERVKAELYKKER